MENRAEESEYSGDGEEEREREFHGEIMRSFEFSVE